LLARGPSAGRQHAGLPSRSSNRYASCWWHGWPKAIGPNPPACGSGHYLRGPREGKFAALATLELDGDGWADCLTDWRAPFLPAATGGWATYTALDDFFVYNGSGVQPGRTWVIAPDRWSLATRWQRLISETNAMKKNRLFHVDTYKGKFRDRYPAKLIRDGLAGHEHRPIPVSDDRVHRLHPFDMVSAALTDNGSYRITDSSTDQIQPYGPYIQKSKFILLL
jgi:Type ISP C-terminal specificity domain